MEFLRGRRASYVGPLRLYLTCSLLYFAVASFAPPMIVKFSATDRKEAGEAALKRADEVSAQLRERFVHDMPRAMFVIMPVFGMLTWSFYRRVQPYYVSHLYYSLHIHAFAFLVLAVQAALTLLGRYGQMAGSVITLLIVGSHYAALRRVFGGTRLQTAWKGTALALLYLVLMVATFGVLVLLLIKGPGPKLHPS